MRDRADSLFDSLHRAICGRVIIFDTETTGMSNVDEICQIAAVEYMHGTLAHFPSGTGGFGYDPLFIPEGMETTLGHIPADVKNRLSHRFKALKQVYDFLKTHTGLFKD